MPDDARSALDQDARLAELLGALASPVRLALLRELRVARALREIRVAGPPRAAESSSDERVLSRQAVRDHLDRLLEAGVVVPRETEREYGPTVEYVLNHQEVFALAEDLRELARLRPREELARATAAAQPGEAAEDLAGPCLVLVHGLEEGRRFDLAPGGPGGDAWVVGRRRGLAVSLDFDPYVSTENAVVRWEGGGHLIEDLPGTRNGTRVNFRPLARGERRRLRTGDLVGVGRTLLLYRGPDA